MPSQRVLTQPALADLATVPAQSRWVTSGSVRLHVLDYGGDGVPVLVVPGITSPAISMDFVARELTGLVRPIILDARGRGFSDDGPSYSLEDYAADTEAVISGLGLDRPVLLGHSMGARIAAFTAAKSAVALRGTVLVDPPMSGPGRGPYPTPVAVFRSQLEQAWRGTDDFFDFWPMVPAPTVLVHGADSPVVTAAGAEEAARTNSAARLVPIPAAGHMVFWDNPKVALETVRAVLHELVS
jgi:N-formylmaleamate deformylase